MREAINVVLFTFCVFGILFNVVNAQQTIRLDVDFATYVNYGEPATSHGAESILFTGYEIGSSTQEYITLLKFEEPNIPSGSIINSATLYLTRFTNAGSCNICVRRITSSWSESATYNYRPTISTSNYDCVSQSTGDISFDVTELIEDWEGGTSNYGVAIRYNSGSYDYYNFYSEEYPVTEYHPYISVTFTAPSNDPPSIEITDPNDLITNINIPQGTSWSFSWNGNDPDDAADVRLAMDTDRNYDNGGYTWISGWLSEDGSYNWNTSGFPQGVYYLLAYITDDEFEDHDYSVGTITITPPGGPAQWVNYYCDYNTVDGTPIPVGTIISAIDPDGIFCGEYTVSSTGAYGPMEVYRDDPLTPQDEGAVTGDVIRFLIGSDQANTSGNVIYPSSQEDVEVCLSIGSGPSDYDFCDEFNDGIENWIIQTGNWYTLNGYLVGEWSISNANGNVGNIVLDADHQPTGDFVFETEGVVSSYGQVANGFYIILYNSDWHKYSIGFNPELNEIHIHARISISTGVPIYIDDNSSGIMNSGVGSTNKGKLVKEGENYHFYINDHFITTFQDEYFGGDTDIGLQVYGTTVYERVCLSSDVSVENQPFTNDDNTMLLWHLDEGAGTITNDASDYAHDGTLSVDSWESDPYYTNPGFGSAFESGAASIETPSTTNLDFATGSFTIECWIRAVNGSPGSFRYIIGKRCNYPGTDNCQYSLCTDDYGVLKYFVSREDNAYITALTDPSFAWDNAWHHIAGVRDVNAGELRLYVDGELRGTEPFTDDLYSSSSYPLMIGDHTHSTTSNHEFNGLIDEVRISNIVRYGGGETPQQELIAHWDFNEGVGAALTDITGNDHDGVISGASWTDGVEGSALSFDGAGDFVQFNSSVLNEPPYSICAWVKPASNFGEAHRYVITNGGETNGSYGFSLSQDPEVNEWAFYGRKDGEGGLTSGGIIETDWIFLVATWDGSRNNNRMKLYINGELASESTAGDFTTSNSPLNLKIGNTAVSASHFFHGLIDEASIYNYVLDDVEISQLYEDYLPEEEVAEAGYFIHITDMHVTVDNDQGWPEKIASLANLEPKPAFVLASGDLVDWGHNGEENYDALLAPLYPKGGEAQQRYIDVTQEIPIYFCPGNHDAYGENWFSISDNDRRNGFGTYNSKIGESYFSENIPYSKLTLFSLNSGMDVADQADLLPESDGLRYTDGYSIGELEHDLENGIGQNRSKIIMMHHPHVDLVITDEGGGAFRDNNVTFTELCNTNNVNLVLCGHIHDRAIRDNPYNTEGDEWQEGDVTKFIVTQAFKDGWLRRIYFNEYGDIININPNEKIKGQVIMNLYVRDSDGNWVEPTSEISISDDSFETIENKIIINYPPDMLSVESKNQRNITYDGKQYLIEYYYPEYLYDASIPFYYDVYLYPDNQYFKGNDRYLAAFVGTTETPETSNSIETIFMVHGTCGSKLELIPGSGLNSKYWTRSEENETGYRRMFTERGGYDVFQFNFPSLQNIRNSSYMLGEIIDATRGKYYNNETDRKFNIVTHSQGGLVARGYLAGLGKLGEDDIYYNSDVKSLIQIAPTNHGTFYGYLGEYLTQPQILGEQGFQGVLDELIANAAISALVGDFNNPATKQQACGSKFLWELNDIPLIDLVDNSIATGYMVIAGDNAIIPPIQGIEAHDGIVSLASASLLGYANIPLIVINADHGSGIPAKRGFLHTEDVREDVYTLINNFIINEYNTSNIKQNIGELTGNDADYVDQSNVDSYNPGGQISGIWGSVEIQPTNMNEVLHILNKPILEKTTFSINSSKVKLIANINNDWLSNEDNNENYDNTGPFTYITLGPIDEYLVSSIYSILEPGDYTVKLMGKKQPWSVNVKAGEVSRYEQTFEFPGIYARIIGECPVDLEVEFDNGVLINKDNSSGDNWIYYREDVNNDGALDVVVEIADFDEDVFKVNVIPHDTAQSTDSVTLYINTQESQDTIFANTQIEDINEEGYSVSILDTASICGLVSNEDYKIPGASISLLDTIGNVIENVLTSDEGYYEFTGIENDYYLIDLNVPLGHNAITDPIVFIKTRGLRHEVNFQLEQTASDAECFSFWWWKRQFFYKNLGGCYEQVVEITEDGINQYGQAIYDHFYSRGDDYAIQIDSVTHIGDPARPITFEEMSELFLLPEINDCHYQVKRSIRTVMLNFASGRMSQLKVVSEDGATASQALTYLTNLYLTGDQQNIVIANINLQWLHYGRMIPAGIIPLSTPNVMYKIDNEIASNSDNLIPEEYTLMQNFPNPFNPITEIGFGLPVSSDVVLEVFNISGQRVETIVAGYLEAGQYSFKWDGSKAASGIYLYRLKAGEYELTKKMILLK